MVSLKRFFIYSLITYGIFFTALAICVYNLEPHIWIWIVVAIVLLASLLHTRIKYVKRKRNQALKQKDSVSTSFTAPQPTTAHFNFKENSQEPSRSDDYITRDDLEYRRPVISSNGDYILIYDYIQKKVTVNTESGRTTVSTGQNEKVKVKLAYKMAIKTIHIFKGDVSFNGQIITDNGTWAVAVINNKEPVTVYFGRFDEKEPASATVQANIDHLVASDDGNIIAALTYRSNTGDSYSIIIFDVVKKRKLYSYFRPIFSFTIIKDIDNNYYLKSDEGFRYSLDGTFVDEAAWEEKELSEGRYQKVLSLTQDSYNEQKNNTSTAQETTLNKLLNIEQKSIEYSFPLSGDYFHFRGSVKEDDNQLKEALEDYEKAISLNPDLRIKGKINRLIKAVAKQQTNLQKV